MNRRSPLLLLFGGFALLLSGCLGYQIGPAKPYHLRAVKTVAIPVFQNRSLEPRIESLVTDSVISQFQEDGTFKIDSEDRADAILHATITAVSRGRARSVRGDVEATAEFNLYLTLGYKLEDRNTAEVLDTGTVVGVTSFFVGADLQQQERQAVVLAAENAAVQLTSRISEGF